ncbi:MAG TPA: NYN domain-containing protein [Candidatus Bathyarchaeia archaeon]|nr:NYN domain-containing protein [Candidatus Bathyarchaeia archaeon]
MIIIIDGYNVMKTIYHHGKMTEKERQRFIEKIGEYAHVKRHSMRVVFDGGPYMWPHMEKKCGISVVYVGAKDSADDYIIDYVIRHARKDVLVITSDNAIAKGADEYDIPTLASEDFWSFLTEALTSPVQQVKTGVHAGVKTTTEKNPELDVLFAQYTSVPTKSSDHACHLRKRQETVAKKDRRLVAIIKKL